MSEQRAARLIPIAVLLTTIILVVLLSAIGYVVWASTSGRVITHTDINGRLITIDQRLEHIACVQAIPPAERSEDSLAACRVADEEPNEERK